MKNSVLYIVGGVTLIGVGAIVFFKKKNNKDKDKLAQLQNLTTNVGVGSPTKITEEVKIDNSKDILESAKKIAEARSLATQILDKRTKRNSLMSINQRDYETLIGRTFVGYGSELAFKFNKEQEIKNLDEQIKNLDEQIGKLGYMEVNGSIAKIN
jgi:LPXTG-motif cell wall-anchored protein